MCDERTDHTGLCRPLLSNLHSFTPYCDIGPASEDISCSVHAKSTDTLDHACLHGRSLEDNHILVHTNQTTPNLLAQIRKLVEKKEQYIGGLHVGDHLLRSPRIKYPDSGVKRVLLQFIDDMFGI